jgi:hypothetical protein
MATDKISVGLVSENRQKLSVFVGDKKTDKTDTMFCRFFVGFLSEYSTETAIFVKNLGQADSFSAFF